MIRMTLLLAVTASCQQQRQSIDIPSSPSTQLAVDAYPLKNHQLLMFRPLRPVDNVIVDICNNRGECVSQRTDRPYLVTDSIKPGSKGTVRGCWQATCSLPQDLPTVKAEPVGALQLSSSELKVAHPQIPDQLALEKYSVQQLIHLQQMLASTYIPDVTSEWDSAYLSQFIEKAAKLERRIFRELASRDLDPKLVLRPGFFALTLEELSAISGGSLTEGLSLADAPEQGILYHFPDLRQSAERNDVDAKYLVFNQVEGLLAVMQLSSRREYLPVYSYGRIYHDGYEFSQTPADVLLDLKKQFRSVTIHENTQPISIYFELTDDQKEALVEHGFLRVAEALLSDAKGSPLDMRGTERFDHLSALNAYASSAADIFNDDVEVLMDYLGLSVRRGKVESGESDFVMPSASGSKHSAILLDILSAQHDGSDLDVPIETLVGLTLRESVDDTDLEELFDDVDDLLTKGEKKLKPDDLLAVFLRRLAQRIHRYHILAKYRASLALTFRERSIISKIETDYLGEHFERALLIFDGVHHFQNPEAPGLQLERLPTRHQFPHVSPTSLPDGTDGLLRELFAGDHSFLEFFEKRRSLLAAKAKEGKEEKEKKPKPKIDNVSSFASSAQIPFVAAFLFIKKFFE